LHNRQIHSRQFTRLARETLPQGKLCKSITGDKPVGTAIFRARPPVCLPQQLCSRGLQPRAFSIRQANTPGQRKIPRSKMNPAQTEKGANPWHA